MITFIDTYRDRFSVEFICTTLNAHLEGGFITSRGYRQHKHRGVSQRHLRDTTLIEVIKEVYESNYRVYGERKIWRVLKRMGIPIGREQTARLMRIAGIKGKRKQKNPVTTRPAKNKNYHPDLVQRDFYPDAPCKLWVADITYVQVGAKYVYTAFVTDTYSRKIVGWALSATMDTKALPLQALQQAIAAAKQTTGLIHHSDHGSQYVSVMYNQKLREHGIEASMGSVGDCYDNALAENVNGSYKNELIYEYTWSSVAEVEIATFEWVTWWNEQRLHEKLDYRTPVEVEEEYWAKQETQAVMEVG